MWRTVRRFSVWSCCLLQMRRIRKKKSANLTESMCTPILFQSSPLDIKRVGGQNRREMNFSSRGWWEDYRDLLASVPYRIRARKSLLTVWKQEKRKKPCICTQQITNNTSFLKQTNTRWRTKQIRIRSIWVVSSCQVTQLSNKRAKTVQRQFIHP